MSMISTGRPTSTASFTVTSLLTAATLLITGIATFQSIFANTRITTPSIVTTSTGLGIDVQGGGDIVASSTGSNLWVGGQTSSTSMVWVSATGTNTTSTNLYATHLFWTNATGTNLYVTNFTAGTFNTTNITWTNATGMNLYVSGSLISNYDSVNATTYAVTSADYFLSVSSTSLAVTVTLPAVTTTPAGRVLHIKDKNGTSETNNITVTAYTGNTIDASSTARLNSNYSSISIVNDGVSNWEIF